MAAIVSWPRRNLGCSCGRGGEGEAALSDSDAPDSTRLAARDNTSRGDSGWAAGSWVAITIPCNNRRVSSCESWRGSIHEYNLYNCGV